MHFLATPILIGHICMCVLLRASIMSCIFAHISIGFIICTLLHNPTQATQEDGIEFYGFGALLDSKAQKELSQISGGLHGTEKADRIESIIMRMSEQGQLRGRKVRRTHMYCAYVRAGFVSNCCAWFCCWLRHVESERACVRVCAREERKTATRTHIVFTPQAFSSLYSGNNRVDLQIARCG